MADNFSGTFAKMPKVELHVHLEGTIQPKTLMSLSAKHGINLPPKTLEEFEQWYTFTDFPHFAEVFQASSKCLQTPDDIFQITTDFLEGQASQNILHTEATYTAFTHYKNFNIPFEDQLAAICQAANDARERHNISFGLIIDIARGMVTKAEAMKTARWVADAHGDGLVLGLGLGGYEAPHPAQDYIAPFALAREAGVPAVIHAGETAGPHSIRAAVEHLHAVRIGHGVTVLEDSSVVSLLREREIVLEVCPSSNVCLNVTKSISEHPLPRLIDAGLRVTIGTDDPPIFNTDLTTEYQRIFETFGFDTADFVAFNKVGAACALVDDVRRTELLGALDI